MKPAFCECERIITVTTVYGNTVQKVNILVIPVILASKINMKELVLCS